MNKENDRILIISQYFYPEQFRINDIASEWVKNGKNVTVLTGIPNYPEGKFYKGYGWFKKRKENWNGINIIRIPLVARGHSSVGLILNYLSFVFFGFFFAHFTSIRADKVFTFEVSPMTQALIGVWFAGRRKIPHYLYVQDLWPENVIMMTGIRNKLVIGSIDKMVKYIYRHSTKIYATSPSFVKEIQKKTSEPEKVEYWPQYAEDFYKPVSEPDVDEIPKDSSFKIIFTGNIGYAQGLQILPQTAEHLKDKNVKFVIVGNGRYKDEMVKEIKTLCVEDKFILIDRKPAEEIPKYLGACDIAFVSFADNDLFLKTIPAKLQSYMACAMPVLAVAGGETQRIIEESGCGKAIRTSNPVEVANMIVQMMKDDLSEYEVASLTYYNKHFDKNVVMKMIDI